MPFVLVTAPASEPLTLAEVKSWVRIDSGSQEPAPGAPTVALLSPAAAGNVESGAHRYLVTFVTADGETEAGTPSAAVIVADKAIDGKVAVSGIPLGGASVTARKLYRTAAAGAIYLLLATIADNTTTTYIDSVADASLGAGAPSVNTTDDPLLNMLIASVRGAVETMTRRALITQTWDMVLDRFPAWEMSVAKSTLQSVVSITYVDVDGMPQTLDEADYLVDASSEPARLTPAFGKVWPLTRWQTNAVRVRFVAGYGSASAVPQGIKTWMAMRIATLWDNRTEFILTDNGRVEIPHSFVDRMLDPYRVDDFTWAAE